MANNNDMDTAKKRLFSFIERMERLIKERNSITEDLNEVKAEAKGVGFNVKVIDKFIKRRAMDPEKRQEEDALLELYEDSISGFEHTVLGQAIAVKDATTEATATIN